jgi:hypothetical protein
MHPFDEATALAGAARPGRSRVRPVALAVVMAALCRARSLRARRATRNAPHRNDKETSDMTRSARQFLATIAAAALLAGCATMGGSVGWTTLVDGAKGLDNFTRVGDANWTAVDGALQATQGGKDPAYLVSKQSYTNFQMRVEFWASDDANSGVFMRCQDRNAITDETCYEANIFDQRPDPTYGTGAIVKVAAVSPMPKAGGKWNVYEITAKGTQLTLVLNGVKTVDVHDSKLASGPFALQWGRGTIKFRKVQIRAI